ncbi:type II secretion system (T2SS), F family protein [Collimonas arenae]|uniref:Type II secretion system (T2SS), F family protein n=1 Tax=Collimonas arenae TaxID=279058 RepID=A0A127QF15_9BURK|nr:type II secretion system F family protein [Collimonas arenae]AMO98755.1 type II secretion system (T2SS), F family protein [Collimonas arenae]AMP08648.1 type II secretion system (T2SS), F family protein [Collimonas arenae]
MSTTQHTLIVLAILLLASALLLVGGALLGRAWRLKRNLDTVEQKIAAHDHPTGAAAMPAQLPWKERLVALSADWLDTPLGRQLVAEEDRHLLDQCGVNDRHGKAWFFFARVVLAICLPLIGLFLFGSGVGLKLLLILFFGMALGYMLPKWVMQRVAKKRQKLAAEELPLLIDLLRLLQGVGLSVDQSLHVIENEFSNVLKVLGQELAIAGRQYSTGRSREQSMRRFSTIFDNEDLHAVSRLLVQVEHHGGAVQEPLKQFSERIREQRKLDMKEKIGKLTVKMTGVMVVTLLPGLLVITGGVGFLAVIRALSKMGANI